MKKFDKKILTQGISVLWLIGLISGLAGAVACFLGDFPDPVWKYPVMVAVFFAALFFWGCIHKILTVFEIAGPAIGRFLRDMIWKGAVWKAIRWFAVKLVWKYRKVIIRTIIGIIVAGASILPLLLKFDADGFLSPENVRRAIIQFVVTVLAFIFWPQTWRTIKKAANAIAKAGIWIYNKWLNPCWMWLRRDNQWSIWIFFIALICLTIVGFMKSFGSGLALSISTLIFLAIKIRENKDSQDLCAFFKVIYKRNLFLALGAFVAFLIGLFLIFT